MRKNYFVGCWAALLLTTSLCRGQEPGSIGTVQLPGASPVNSIGTVELPGPSPVNMYVWGDPCPPPAHMWFTSEYLLWSTKGGSLPVVTTGPDPASVRTKSTVFVGEDGVVQAADPSLGAGTNEIFGTKSGLGPQSGGRFTLGGWIDADQFFGVEGSYFFLGSRATNFVQSSKGRPDLALPFVDASTGALTGYTIAQAAASSTSILNGTFGGLSSFNISTRTITDAYAGIVSIKSSSSMLDGTELNADFGLVETPGARLELLAGARYVELDERLGIGSNVTHTHTDDTVFDSSNTGIFTPILNSTVSVVTRLDQFDTKNSFYGGQMGLRGAYDWGALVFMGGAKVALGDMHQVVDITGGSASTVTNTVTPTTTGFPLGFPITVPTGAPAVTTVTHGVSSSGLFAQPTNQGNYSRNVFAVIPEANFKVGLRFNNYVMATVGYTFLYVSNVVRPNDQVDRAISPSLLTLPPGTAGATSPVFQFHSTDYWAQGVDFGLQFTF